MEDGRLDSEEVLVRAKGGAFTLDYKPLPGALWRMGGAQSDSGIAPERWLEDSDRDAYLAWLDGQLAGQMLVEAWEYGLARVRDVRVALSLRRRGVGESLLALAEEWARAKHFGGLCAETQDGNAGACSSSARAALRWAASIRSAMPPAPRVRCRPAACAVRADILQVFQMRDEAMRLQKYLAHCGPRRAGRARRISPRAA